MSAEPQPGTPEWDALEELPEREVQRVLSIVKHVKALLNIAKQNQDDELGLILRMHLVLELAITEQLESKFVRDDVFDWSSPEGPPFLTKAKFAKALGILDDKSYEFAKKLGHIRNEFGHSLNKILTEKDFAALNVPQARKLLSTAINELTKYQEIAFFESTIITRIFMHDVNINHAANPKKRVKLVELLAGITS